MDRRAFVAGSFALLAAPLAAEGQSARVNRVAILLPFATAEALPYRDAFFDAMHTMGYVDGKTVVFDVRTSDRDRLRVPALVDELIALRPDVFVGEENVALVVRAKAPSIPIVLPASIDPVGSGLARTLRRPGMNVTGVTLLLDELAVKHIDIMREIVPRLKSVGLMFDTTARICKIIEEGAHEAARKLGARFVSYYVANRDGIVHAFSRMELKERPDLLLPCPTPMLFNNRDLLFESAVRLRTPFTSFVVANVPLGVLFSYGPSFAEGYRKAATYVDRIFKGADPADLPMEQPTKFELVINLKTAKALGLTISPSLLLRADRVIE